MGGSLLMRRWGAGRGSPGAERATSSGLCGGLVIGSGRGDNVSHPLAHTRGLLLCEEQGGRSGLAWTRRHIRPIKPDRLVINKSTTEAATKL